MFDLRPINSVIGTFLIVFGSAMLLPAFADLVNGHRDWAVFALCALLTMIFGLGLVNLGRGGNRERLSIQQTFLLTVIAWFVLPLFGALPFMLAEAPLSFLDAFFEAMSGITTTGATVLEGLQQRSAGILLWRGLLQWFGGLGIVVVAIAILPELRIGGMQLFRSEAFDTFGKILPQAAQIASQLTLIYVGLTFAAILVYAACGMKAFDALVHAMTTIATGGLANYDSSFGAFGPAAQYAAVAFMLMSALPYVRFVQLVNGSAVPLLKDRQIRTFFVIIATVVGVLALSLWRQGATFEESARAALFNSVSIMTGTGYATEDYGRWGPMAVAIFFIIALIGGCAGSTSCSVKVFRYQVLWATISAQVRAIHNPSGVFRARYDGRPISDEILSSVMAFFLLFFATLGALTLGFSMLGLDLLTALSGAAAALGNVGPGLGPMIGPSGNYAEFPETGKWLFIVGMFVGRLELLSVFVLLVPRFWWR